MSFYLWADRLPASFLWGHNSLTRSRCDFPSPQAQALVHRDCCTALRSPAGNPAVGSVLASFGSPPSRRRPPTSDRGLKTEGPSELVVIKFDFRGGA